MKSEQKEQNKFSQLKFEYNVYKHLNITSKKFKQKFNIDFPKCYDFWETEKENFMVMELMGPNLQQLLNICHGCFSVSTTCILVKQMISLMELIHKHGLIHTDLKPENLTIGLYDNKLYLIDFGLSRKYIYQQQHVLYEQLSHFIGSFRYASVNQHLNVQVSRRDDMESIMYIMIYFLNGQLPWQNIQAEGKKDRNQKILKLKMQLGTQELTKMLPKQIEDMFIYIRTLKFQEPIDYNYLRNQITEIQIENDCLDDEKYGILDWNQYQFDRMTIINENKIDINYDENNQIQDQQDNKQQLYINEIDI